MIRAEYWEATRLAAIDDRVGYEWQSATGRLAVSYVLAIGKNSFHMQWENFSLENPSSLTFLLGSPLFKGTLVYEG